MPMPPCFFLHDYFDADSAAADAVSLLLTPLPYIFTPMLPLITSLMLDCYFLRFRH